MNSKLLAMLFEPDRWERAIETGVLKGIDKGELREFCDPDVRVRLYKMIRDNKLEFQPAHEAKIPKDEPGEFRIVYVGETTERIVCALINECLFELFPEMVHPACKSYQKGLGTGATVRELSQQLVKLEKLGKGKVIGGKYDFHHYFDTVRKDKVFELFNKLERKLGMAKGTDPVINLLRRTWNNDLMFDIDGNLIEKWSGIRQGNAVAAFMADAVLYELDDYMSKKYQYYVRYSDDMVVVHNNVNEVTCDINRIIKKYGVTLNPKKIETLYKGKWFKFLGYALKDDMISLSRNRIKTFQREIKARTINDRTQSLEKAVNAVNRYLYKGNGEYAWAEQVLGVINVDKDINVLNNYVMDALRAVETKKRRIGGLGYVVGNEDGAIARGKGRNVRSNREKTEKIIQGYKTLTCMRNALVTDKGVYATFCLSM